VYLFDAQAERSFGFHMHQSIAKARVARVFDGLFFTVTPHVVPPPAEMEQIIVAAGVCSDTEH
jgi:hypothetical protein